MRLKLSSAPLRVLFQPKSFNTEGTLEKKKQKQNKKQKKTKKKKKTTTTTTLETDIISHF